MVRPVEVIFRDMGAAAALGAIRVERYGKEFIVVDTGISDQLAFEALGQLLCDPPAFPLFRELRESARAEAM